MSYKTYNNYKDSNIDWIKEIPTTWSISRVKNISLIKSGESPKFDENGQYDVIGANGKIGKTNRFNVSTNHIIIGRVGASGSVNISPEFAFISDNAFILNLNKNVDLKYSFYLFKALDMDRLINKNAQPLLTATQIKNLFIPHTTLEEQQQIANYLDKKTAKIDATIAKNEELIQLLEEKRVALINQVVTKGLNPDVPMKDSGVEWIGEIPEHWDFIPVDKFSSLITDYVANGSFASLRENVEYLDEENYAILVRLIDNSNNFNGPFVYISEESYAFLSKTKLQKGDIILANIGATLGTVFKVPDLGRPMSLGPNVLLIRFDNKINGEYFLNLIDSNIGKCFIDSITTQTTQPKFNKTELRKLRILHPPLNEQEQINNEINDINTSINTPIIKIKEQIVLLEEYKTSLIHHVVTGKIDVRSEEI